MDTELKTVLDGIGVSVHSFGDRLTNLQKQVDSIDLQTKDRITPEGSTKAFVDILKENESFAKLVKDGRGSAIITLQGREAQSILSRKDPNVLMESTTGSQTTGVLTIGRIPGITPEARQRLTVRNLFTQTPTEAMLVDFVRVTTPMQIASPEPEASASAENTVVFTAASERLKSISTWIPATRRILADFGELANFLQTSVAYYCRLAEEKQFISGDNIGEDLDGIAPQATAFNPTLLSASSGWNQIDILGRGLEQLALTKEIDPDWIIVNPTDWYSMRLLKDSLGKYILGPPGMEVSPTLFGKTIVPTTSINPGVWLMGSSNPIAAEIRDRMELQYEVSSGYMDYFVNGMVACRGELRTAMVVKRPQAFLSGTFSQSPAVS
jgi:HK97 family phage major capsid protein